VAHHDEGEKELCCASVMSMDPTTPFHIVDKHLSGYLDQIRRGDCDEVIRHVRERLWMADLDISPTDRAITEALLQRMLTCLEQRPEPDLTGAFVAAARARVYWQRLGRQSVANFRDHLSRSLARFRQMVLARRLDDLEQELGERDWLPDGSGFSAVDWMIAETNSIIRALAAAARDRDTEAALRALDRLGVWIEAIRPQ
jgi:hypothetical protein